MISSIPGSSNVLSTQIKFVKSECYFFKGIIINIKGLLGKIFVEVFKKVEIKTHKKNIHKIHKIFCEFCHFCEWKFFCEFGMYHFVNLIFQKFNFRIHFWNGEKVDVKVGVGVGVGDGVGAGLGSWDWVWVWSSGIGVVGLE